MAAGAGLVAFGVYLLTLAPGLVSEPDSAMFQFIGRVLGVAHNPGYPLYVLLTHAFSYLPIGSLAYRINLFSALLGSLTVSLTFLIARRLGCRQVIAAGAALALAFGQVYWSQAVIAEVYTLNAAIVAGVLLALLTWGETRRPAWYFTAVAIFAAGLGHHTTIVGFAPGIALFALLVDRPFILRLRTLAMTVGILALGLSQYLFILLRSNQPDAYVESPATTLDALARVVMGRQFQSRLFAFGAREVFTKRLPNLVETIFVPEMTIIGVALALTGTIWLAARRTSAAILLTIGGIAIFAFALNYSVIDTPVFLIPSLLVAWLLAAVGAEQVVCRLPGRLNAGVASLFLLLPAWLAVTNFADSDRSRDVLSAVTLDRLFAAVPDRTSFVEDDFIVNRMVTYKARGEDMTGRRGIALVAADPAALRGLVDSGAPVFVFRNSAQPMRFEGLDVSFAPLQVVEGQLERFLRRLPDDSTVAIAVPAADAGAFIASGSTSMTAIGGPADMDALAGLTLALVGVRGRTGADLRSSRSGIALDVAAGDSVGHTARLAPGAIGVRADPFEASILQSGREIVRSGEGAVMAVWEPDGDLVDTYVLEAARGFGVPLSSGPLSAYALHGSLERHRLAGDRWMDVSSSFQSGSVMVRVASGGEVVIYLGDDVPMAPRVIDSSDRGRVDISSGGTMPAADLARELDDAHRSQLAADGKVCRIAIEAFAADVSVYLAVGGIPAHAFGRVTRAASVRTADIFRIDTRGLLRSPDGRSDVLLMGRDAQAQLTGDGWSDVDWDAAGPFRWMTATEARVLLPVSSPSTALLRVQALRESRSPETAIRLRVNGVGMSPQPLRAGWRVYEWAVPVGTVTPGINEVSVQVDRLADVAQGRTGGKGVAVSDLRLIHVPTSPP